MKKMKENKGFTLREALLLPSSDVFDCNFVSEVAALLGSLVDDTFSNVQTQ